MSFGDEIVNLAMKQLGKPYVWGGEGPNGFDCSGLCMFVYRRLTGVTIPHNDQAQWDWWGYHPELCQRYSRASMGGPENLRPGDFMWPQYEGGPGNGHEMIVVNSTTYIQAPYTGKPVGLYPIDWNLHDTAHGGARGMRFGRFARLTRPGGEPPSVEEDEMFEVIVPFVRVNDQGEQHVWVATEGWYDLAQASGACYLVIKNEGAACNFDIFTTPPLTPSGNPNQGKYSLPEKNNPGSRGTINMQALGAPRGGFATTIKCTSANIVPQITIMAKAK